MKRDLCWHAYAWEDYLYWFQQDKKNFQKINTLIHAIDDNPHHGIGKPEVLKHVLKGFWSRRINIEHRLVYQTNHEQIIIVSCRYHYESICSKK